MPEAIMGPVAGAVVGGLMGGDGGGGSQTQSKEPWEPARQPLINSLNTGQDLERYYQQNPFNRLQQQGYQNLFGDLDMFRNQLAPGLMDFANQMMGSNYQIGSRYSSRGNGGGGGGGMGGGSAQRPTNMWQPSPGMPGTGQAGGGVPQDLISLLLGGAQGGQGGGQGGGMNVGGLLGGGPFTAPARGSYGLVDFPELNPHTSTRNGIPARPAPAAPAPKTPEETDREEWERRRISGEGYRGEGA